MAEEQQGQAQAQAQAQAQDENQPQFALQRIYLKDMSFESPASPEVFRGQWSPKVKLDVNTGAIALDGDLFETVLTVTVTVENADKVAYLVEVKQAGIFGIKNIPDETKSHLLATLSPATLFPYAREAVDNAATRGGFPPLHLAPINFEAMYAEAAQQRAESGTEH